MDAFPVALSQSSPWVEYLPGTRSCFNLSKLTDIDRLGSPKENNRYHENYNDSVYNIVYFFDQGGYCIESVTAFRLMAPPFADWCGCFLAESHAIAQALSRCSVRDEVRYIVCFRFGKAVTFRRRYAHSNIFSVSPDVFINDLLIKYVSFTTGNIYKSIEDALSVFEEDAFEVW